MRHTTRARLACAVALAAGGAGLAGFAASPLLAQGAPAVGHQLPAGPQLRVIAIPYARQGEDIRTVLDADFDRRMAIAKVQEALEARGFAAVDFLGALQQARLSAAGAAESESDFRTRLLEMHRADVYVVTDVSLTRRDGMLGATVILKAHLTANGMSLGSKDGNSGLYEGVESARLVGRAVENSAPPLLDLVGERMARFVEQGVPVLVELRVASGSAVDLASPVGDTSRSLAAAVETWLRGASRGGIANVATVTRNLMTVTDVRLPIRDANGHPSSPLRFSEELLAYLRTVGVPSPSRSVSNGAIYVELR